METDIPYNVLMILKENSDLKKYGANIDYFSKEEYQNYLKEYEENLVELSHQVEAPIELPL